jgi:HAD superfamily hydrolase (TIGR01509 family)
MVEAILCDIDGTLVDSNHLHAKAWQDAFAAMDIHVGFDDALCQIGKGGDQLMPVFVPEYKLHAVEKPLEAYRKFVFQTDYLSQVKPFPKVREFLLRLKDEGVRLSLASSASKEDLKIYKKIAHMEDLIEESSSSDDAERSKPHPDIFSATLEKLGVSADHAIALGDTPYDAEAAGKCGLRTIGLTCGGWSAEDLTKAGCVEVYRDVADLLENFERSALMR